MASIRNNAPQISLDQFPPVTEALIRAIEGVFPVVLPAADARVREVWIKVGQQNVVDYLRRVHAHQLDEARRRSTPA